MTDTEFLQLEKEILTELWQMKKLRIDDDFQNKLHSLRIQITSNYQNQYVQDFITKLINIHLYHLIDQNLINSLKISDYYHHYKQFNIYKSIQQYLMQPLSYYLSDTLEVPSDIRLDILKTLFYVIQNYAPNLKKDSNIQAIEYFVNANPSIIRGSKDDYFDLEKEIELYKLAKHGFVFKELEIYAFLQQQYPEDARRSFINKRIGNIGEIYVYEYLKEYSYTYFVSRDIKNGFGYDIYYLDANNIENLVEVKATILDKEDDTFYMSENEYKVMMECATNPHARYLICRVKLDNAFKPTFSFLTVKDEQTLVDVKDNQIEYKLSFNPDNSITCKKNPLTLTRIV